MPGPYTDVADGVDTISATRQNAIYDGLETEMRVFKTADQTVATTTLGNVTDLSFTVAASTLYAFEFWLVYQAAVGTTGLKIAVAVTTATSDVLVYEIQNPIANGALGTDNLSTQQFQASAGTLTQAATVTATTNYIAFVRGVISVTGTGGTITLQFAGDAAANITAKKGSFGKLYKAG